MLVQDTRVKLYLEGLRIPFVSININETAGATYPTASITLPALKEGFKLLPRTQVHVFYKLSSNVAPVGDKFYLIFEGELATINYSQTSGTRYVSLGCAGIFNYFGHGLKGMGSDPTEVDMSNDTLVHFNFTNREDMSPEVTSGGDDAINKKISERD